MIQPTTLIMTTPTAVITRLDRVTQSTVTNLQAAAWVPRSAFGGRGMTM
jgi:hypothetical protein